MAKSKKKKLTICGIDPGLAAGGVVLVAAPKAEIIAVERLSSSVDKEFKEGYPGDSNFADTMRRAEAVTQKIVNFVKQKKPDLVSIESFVDFGSQAKMTNKQGGAFFAKDRWKVPLIIGYFSAELEKLGIPIVYVNAAILRQYSDEIAMLETQRQKKKVNKNDLPSEATVVKNDYLLTNDHLVKAWCHADWATRHYYEILEKLLPLSKV